MMQSVAETMVRHLNDVVYLLCGNSLSGIQKHNS